MAAARRPAPSRRGYDWAWQKLRGDLLRLNPLCADCRAAGRATAAAEVHHVESIDRAPARRLDPTNLVALCKACHSRRTARGE